MRNFMSCLICLVSTFAMETNGFSQNCDPLVLACTDDNAVGTPGYDDFGSDITFRSNPNISPQEVWVLEAAAPGFNDLDTNRITVFDANLQRLRSFNTLFSEGIFGIAEILDHPTLQEFAWQFIVLSPGWTTGIPKIGIMDEFGKLVPGGEFATLFDPRINDIPPGFYTSIDMHPFKPELAIVGTYQFLFVNAVAVDAGGQTRYEVIRGPFDLKGESPYFGGGIAYNPDSNYETVLVIEGFHDSFEAHLALEYNINTGDYTGRSVVLDHRLTPTPVLEPIMAMGLDTGFIDEFPVSYIYNLLRDAVYAIPFDIVEAPGPVLDLGLYCLPSPDGRVELNWTNDPNFQYDRILVRENGAVVASLPGDATGYQSPHPIQGKYQFCVEPLKAGADKSEIQMCCEGESEILLQISTVPISPNSFDYQMGIATPRQVENQDDFRAYIIGSFDNTVRVVDINFNIIDEIATDPPSQSNNVDWAATGIALVDLEIEGQTVPMYFLLDGDGIGGTYITSASVHFLEDTVLPSGAVPAGSRYKDEIGQFDLSAISGGGTFFIDWDSDQAGDLVSVDSQSYRIVKFHYDQENHTIAAVAEAPLPQRGLAPFLTRNFPQGGVTVLPSGYYLVAGGTVFDPTILRAYLTAPLDPDSGAHCEFLGHADGLLSHLDAYTILDPLGFSFGLSNGPELDGGFETTYLREEDRGIKLYQISHYFVDPVRYLRGNYLVGMDTSIAHPDLVAEQLLDQNSTVGAPGTLDTATLIPGFADQASFINYHYHVLNPSEQFEQHLRVTVFLDEEKKPELGEDEIWIPAGRNIYRAIRDRSEKAIRLEIDNLGTNPSEVRVLVTATALSGGEPPVPPTGLVATAGDGQVELDWADNPEVTGIQYNVLRSTTAGGPYLQVNIDPLSDSEYLDTGLTNGTTYYYVVEARGPGGKSPFSSEVNATPYPPGALFRRGDTDGNGAVELTDVIRALTWQFVGGLDLDCQDAADIDDDGAITLTDAIRSLSFQFVGVAGTIPEPPGPLNCGPDETPDSLPECVYPSCP